MRLCVIFAVVALASARPDVSELSGYKYSQASYSSGPAIYQSGASQYASGGQISGGQISGGQIGSGSLEVIPLNLAHVSSTVLRSGEGSFGGSQGGQSYSSNNYQYSSGAGNNLGSQYYNAGGNFGGQQYSAGASQYSSGAGLGAQIASGAGLGGQYSSGGAIFTDSASQGSFAAGGSSDASGYQQLINDVLNGKYTVGSYSAGASSGSAQKQKISINIQPNQAPVTYRHVYFAEAPAEAPVRPRISIDGGIQQRKHVKVVFIKTPDQGGLADQELTLPQLEEEKTKIYVLSKEHNQQPQIRIKAGAAGTASRPEIFFLKYRSEAEALKAQQVLREGASQGSFSSGNIIDGAGFSGGQASGFSGGQASGGSSGFSSGLASGLSSGLSSGISGAGASNNAFQSGLSTGLSSGFSSNSASSFQSGGSLEGASIANLPLKQETNFASSGSKGVTTLYGSPDHSSAGYA